MSQPEDYLHLPTHQCCWHEFDIPSTPVTRAQGRAHSTSRTMCLIERLAWFVLERGFVRSTKGTRPFPQRLWQSHPRHKFIYTHLDQFRSDFQRRTVGEVSSHTQCKLQYKGGMTYDVRRALKRDVSHPASDLHTAPFHSFPHIDFSNFQIFVVQDNGRSVLVG